MLEQVAILFGVLRVEQSDFCHGGSSGINMIELDRT